MGAIFINDNVNINGVPDHMVMAFRQAVTERLIEDDKPFILAVVENRLEWREIFVSRGSNIITATEYPANREEPEKYEWREHMESVSRFILDAQSAN